MSMRGRLLLLERIRLQAAHIELRFVPTRTGSGRAY